MRITLVNVPWSPIGFPSVALGLLKSLTLKEFPEADVDVVYGNLDFVDWITKRVPEFNYEDYRYYDLESCYIGTGDWVFSSALYHDPQWKVPEFLKEFGPQSDADGQNLAHGTNEVRRMQTTLWLHEHVEEFTDELARRIVAGNPEVVGFTTTFQTLTASMAVARRVKELAPQTLTVFGGANCEGSMGEALHRNFDFVDYVVRGEGELAWPGLLRALYEDEASFTTVPGLCWRDESATSQYNPVSKKPLPPAAMVMPHYDEYVAQFAKSHARFWLEPRLVLESSRGCWWGEKHHCTFCGLNGASMMFRSKRPEQFFNDLVTLTERHKILDVMIVDNILDMSYLDSLLPRLAEADLDLRLMYEMKANMKYEQLEIIANGGVVCVQPGIESLSSKVLKLMDKGVSGCLNVRVLRDAESLGLTVAWAYLYGFPGETDEDYTKIIEQFPVLHHLEPAGGDDRLAVQRFAPYFENPSLGFHERWAAPQYGLTYDLPEKELFDLAYIFKATHKGIGNDLAWTLRSRMNEWRDAHWYSQLSYFETDEGITLTNTRPGFDWDVVQLTTEVEIALFQMLDQPRKLDYLQRECAKRFGTTDISSVIDRWMELGLLFTDDGRLIHVVTRDRNQRFMQIRVGQSLAARPEAEAPALQPAASAQSAAV
ncbi:RiPP maturation radical SAM C-methyltransferase [Streptomyces globisporus]|uniref:RiPP maturation radical SAM C-methyltransferase n=1 Tax=Streptomyces globisporus TaxID=1908 RepID=UPI0037B65DC7